MSFVTAAVIGAGGAILGGVIAGSASRSAANTQANAANQGTQAQMQMFNTVNQQNAPWRQAGQTALNQIMYGIGGGGTGSTSPYPVAKAGGGWLSLPGAAGSTVANNAGGYAPGGSDLGYGPGYFTHQFNANDLNSYLAPNYAFMLNQGLGAIKNAGNAQSGLISGNTLKGITDYAENYAGNAYQNAYNNYTAQQQNIFNRLSTIAGFGSTANQTVAPVASSTGQGIAQTLGAAGQATASGTVGMANAISGGINNAASWYMLPQIMGYGGGNVSIGNPGGVTQIGDYGAS